MKAPKIKLPRRSSRRRARANGLLDKAGHGIAKLPGPSNNPATNLLVGDIAMRGISMLLGRGIEKVMLTTRYDAEKAAGIVQGRSMTQSLVATGAARVATRSIPGFLLVSGGLAAKSVFDRVVGGRQAVHEGDRQLDEMAEKADEA